MKELKRIKELISKLNQGSDEYYNNKPQSMTDKEWDSDFDELSKLESQTGIVFSNSPTQNVGYEIVKGLKEAKHRHPLLSLDKSKEVNDIIKFKNKDHSLFGDKLDGLTLSLTYENGLLIKGATRGDGEIGYDVTHNVKRIKSIPQKIPYDKPLTVSGECVSSYDNFNKINEEAEDPFSHPRMMASGSMKQLDSKIFEERGLDFVLFSVDEGFEELDSKNDTFKEMKNLGFKVWNYFCVCPSDDNIEEMISHKENENHEYPLDGMVITYDSKSFSKSLGRAEKYPNHSRALKWEDETYETTVKNIIIDVGRTGQVSFKAEFKTVLIDGSEVSNATLHNPTRVNELGIGVGATVTVYKAGKIIPQVDEVIVAPKIKFEFDYKCPYCGEKVEHKTLSDGTDSENVFCVNDRCKRVNMKCIAHFVSKTAMDIEGMSEKTIEAIMDEYLLSNNFDLYNLHLHKNTLLSIDRFGEKKVSKLLEAIEKSKNQPLNKILCGMGISNIGEGTSKKLANGVGDLDSLSHILMSLSILHMGNKGSKDCLDVLHNTIGVIATESLYENRDVIFKWCDFFGELDINPSMEKRNVSSESSITGLTFVVTGKITHFKNRKELEAKIESLGGKNGKGVTSKTDFLINNNFSSTTGKNLKANELGVKIVTEEQFLELIK